eukprot:11676306-Heterocapsa_arctica.AAC.1
MSSHVWLSPPVDRRSSPSDDFSTTRSSQCAVALSSSTSSVPPDRFSRCVMRLMYTLTLP